VPRSTRRVLRTGVASVAFAAFGLGQAPAAIKQDAANASCANIVALAGNVNLNCSSLTAAQRKLIESIPGLLSKLFASQADSTSEILSKLDTCIAQGSDWHLTAEQSKQLTDALKGLHAKISVESLISDRNAPIFAADLQAALKDFGGGDGIPQTTFSAGVNPAFKGVGLVISHQDFPEAEALQKALRAIGLEAPGEIDAKRPTDVINILIGGKPSAR
jgi:hypothetical protein